MDYPQTIEFLYKNLPVFHRIGAPAYKPSLENTRRLCQALDNPQDRFRSVHIGGTNGKGSVSHMLAAVLQTAGYRTGLYTSPHLRDFRERIRVNGEMATEAYVTDFVKEHLSLIETIKPSFFELTVAMAFRYFALQQVDIVVVEVGMGGRLDSTNIITPLLSVITNVGFDHVHMLGHTRPAIAGEKAGIIKPGIPVVIGERQEDTTPVFSAKAKETGSPLSFASDEWEEAENRKLKAESQKLKAGQRQQDAATNQQAAGSPQQAGDKLEIEVNSGLYKKQYKLQLDLAGNYQKKNVKTVLSAVEKLQEAGFSLPDEQVCQALSRVRSLTGLAGRWHTLARQPLTICDTAHNTEGIREVVAQLKQTPHSGLHMVIGMTKDKEIGQILELLPGNAHYYFCKAAIPRALDENELSSRAAAAGLQGKTFSSVKQALQAARETASPGDLIFIGGSIFIVAEVV